jgi:hypothetical protein
VRTDRLEVELEDDCLVFQPELLTIRIDSSLVRYPWELLILQAHCPRLAVSIGVLRVYWKQMIFGIVRGVIWLGSTHQV